MLFLHTAHHHAEMSRLHDDTYPLWLDRFLNGLRDLSCEPLLDLQTTRENFDEPGNLAEANHLTFGNIGDMYLAEKRKQVMFAQAEHLDVFDDHHLVIANGEQGIVEKHFRIFAVAFCQKFKGAVDPLGSSR